MMYLPTRNQNSSVQIIVFTDQAIVDWNNSNAGAGGAGKFRYILSSMHTALTRAIGSICALDYFDREWVATSTACEIVLLSGDKAIKVYEAPDTDGANITYFIFKNGYWYQIRETFDSKNIPDQRLDAVPVLNSERTPPLDMQEQIDAASEVVSTFKFLQEL